MTIGIDLRVLARGARTGVEEYTTNLLSRLIPLAPDINFKLFYNAYQKSGLDFPWLFLPNVALYEFKIPNRPLFVSARYFQAPKIDFLLKGADVYFNPHFFNAPVSKKCRKVMTFHDLVFYRHSEFFSWRKRLWQKFLIDARREALAADKIIAVSDSTKADLINFYKINEQKIRLIYSGVNKQFKVINRAEIDEKIKIKYNLPHIFILYFGTIEPRKNLIGLIRAFEIFKRKSGDQSVKLVIAGARGWLYDDIFRTAGNSCYRKEIFFTDFIEEEDKPFLYNLASLFVYPSFFEGFGFPPLEAMACGLPTIVSNNSSLPEVVGDASLMIDPFNIDEMAWAIEMVLTDDKLRNRLRQTGIEQAKKFSWDKCAKETLRVFEDTLG